ncbi:type VI secretion system Vgr family protein [Siccirubricoccus phaeus]|uniref:type VI secretion system Vgr family protein n=1 Tax=Siccirubricoccus phaeus TaxID=2595053 RepID=UPI0011F215AD|nr:type VI secretion system tip protein TssI/VgrG [Siccirubricoccus phaeus]
MVDLLNRHVEIAVSPDPGFKLFFDRLVGTEELGRPFRYEVDLVSTSVTKADLLAVIGSKMTVKILLPDETNYRFFNGVITRAAYLGQGSGYDRYRFELRPMFWLLSQQVKCVIYQQKTLVDIIKQALSDAGMGGQFETAIVDAASLPVQEFVVQYRESTFDFVSRLMEEVGIYYYHKHADGAHTLMLTDDASSHQPIPGAAEIAFFEPDHTYRRKDDHIWDWQTTANITPALYVQRDYNFETSGTDLTSQLRLAPSHSAHNAYEVYDYPGSYATTAEGSKVAAIRMQELAAPRTIAQGEGNIRPLSTGYTFTLKDFADDTQNISHLVIGASYFMTVEETTGEGGETRDTFRAVFQTVPATTPWRPRRLTRRPVITGPQTAKVVGPAGNDDIYTDKYGRVKVQFHWDRIGTNDENSSCWIRVSQPWAGLSYGGIILPRIGQEVVVEFLEGDPDRPIITGRVYNDAQTVPYALPGEKTKSTLKSKSSPNADGFNEIRFEDKAGSEEFFMHAQKDMNIIVLNDQTSTITKNRTVTINDVDDTLTVKTGKRTVTIKSDHTVTVQSGNQAINVDTGNQTTTIKTGNHELKVSAGTSKIDAAQSITLVVGGTKAVLDTSSITLSIGGSTMKMDATSIKLTAGASSVELGPAGAKMSGAPNAEVSGAAMASISGAMVKIN